MKDPYQVLGVSRDSTEDQVKAAYRKLAKKYHPDSYSGSPLADLAEEKMKEINEAYDSIINEKKAKDLKNGGYNNNGWGAGYSKDSKYPDIRKMVLEGRIDDAQQILEGIPYNSRDAEWYFLKGSVLYKRGWVEEAYNNFSRACSMDSSNQEYKAALLQMQRQRQGYYGGYQRDVVMQRPCSCCDICTSLMCADCCCECMGGDCIRCC